MRYKGKITNWNDEKGFGFVEPNGGGNSSFVHIKSFQSRSKRPVDGDLIIYEEIKEPKGKFKAVNISFVADRYRLKKAAYKSHKLGSLITGAFCILLGVFAALGKLPIYALYLYVAANLLTFVFYWIDKSAAQNNRRRTPESTLHLLALLGGWPGAFYAQNILRHKSRKKDFQRAFWGTVIINFCGFLWLISEQGPSLI